MTMYVKRVFNADWRGIAIVHLGLDVRNFVHGGTGKGRDRKDTCGASSCR
jgi:hypothetical protein